MDLDQWLSGVLNGLGVTGIIALFVALAWFMIDWFDEH